MKTFSAKEMLRKELESFRQQQKTIGFVPTMGALHEGHMSLVRASKKENDVTVVSIFVNPTQFNDPDDLKNYPRVFDKDAKLLEQEGCDFVFAPTVEEMYPEEDKRVFEFGMLDKVMEGKYRAGHFNGVAQIVSKLFDAVSPTRAYFGQKDFQQLVIIKEMTRQLELPVQVVPCPIVREQDGLAMSSRNQLLTPEHREVAPVISKILNEAKKKQTELPVAELKKWVIDQVDNNPLLETEYFEIVDDEKLETITDWNTEATKVGCIAVFAGKIRLIDNITF